MSTSVFFPEQSQQFGTDGVDSPYPDTPAQNAIKEWCEAAYEEALGDQSESAELKEVEKYIDYLAGKQWPAGRPSYRAKPINNRMNRLFWELISLLTDIRPIVDIRASERKPEYLEIEKTLNDSTKSWWLNNDIDQKVAMCIVYAVLTTCFAKLEWDPAANMGEGELALHPLGPTALLPLKPRLDLQSSEACIYQDVRAVGWVQRKYPKRAHLVLPDIAISQYTIESGVPRGVTPQLYSTLSPALKRTLARGSNSNRLGVSAYPMCRYREFWMKDYTVNTSNSVITMGDVNDPWGSSYKVNPMEVIYPRGRLIVLAGREIVHDGPNPYWHGQFPFSLLRLNVVPWQLYGMSDLKSWVDLQDIINNILAGVLDMIKRAVNPPLIAPKNSLSEEAWQRLDPGMPGMRLAYNSMAAGEPKVINVAPLPGFVLQVSQNVEREMDQQSGIAAVNEAVRKKQVPGGDTLDQIRQNQQTPIRQKGRNIEIFIRDVGSQLVPNQFQFYRKDKRLYMATGQGTGAIDSDWKAANMLPSGVEPIRHVRKFKFSILEGSLLRIQQTEMKVDLARLRMSGDLSRKTFYEKLSRLGVIDLDAATEEKLITAERQAGVAAMPPKGKKGGPGGAVK